MTSLSSFSFLLTILFSIVIAINFIADVQLLEFEVEEEQSVIWLLDQYQAPVEVSRTNSSSWCTINNSSLITLNCDRSTNNLHITYFSFYQKKDTFHLSGPLNSSLTSFYFPMMTDFVIMTSYRNVTNSSINILSMFGNVNSVKTMLIDDKYTVGSIPDEFAINKPNLSSFSIVNYNFTTIPQSLMNLYADVQIFTYSQTFGTINKLGDDGVPSNWRAMTISLASQDAVWKLNTDKFPKLTGQLRLVSKNNPINLEIDLPMDYISLDLSASTNQNPYNITLKSCAKLNSIQLVGDSPFSFASYDFSVCPLFDRIDARGDYSFFPTKYPSNNPMYLSYAGSSFTTFPNIPPNITNILNFNTNQKLIGSIPSNFVPLDGSSITMLQNPNVVGAIPNSFCRSGFLNLLDNFTSAPDCMLCYWNVKGNMGFPTSITPDPSFVCPFSIQDSTKQYISLDGETIIVDGVNLGWAKNQSDITPGISPIIPNTKFSIPIQGNLTTKQVIFSQYYGYNATFNYLNAGVNIRNLFPKIIFTSMYGATNITIGPFKFVPNVPLYVELDGGAGTHRCYNNTFNPTMVDCVTPVLPSRLYSVKLKTDYTIASVGLAFYSWDAPMIYGISPVQDIGGNITIFGRFGATPLTPKVKIGQVNCSIQSINSTFIICYVENGKLSPGIPRLSVDLNGGYIYSIVIVVQKTKEQICNCQNGASCVNQICYCKSGFFGPTCSSVASPSAEPLNSDTPNSQIKVGDTVYSFALIGVEELDMDGRVVKSMSINKWNITNSTIPSDGSTNYIYQPATLEPPFNLTGFVLNASLTYYPEASSYEFANQVYPLSPNSIKVAVRVDAWPYETTLNTLRLLFVTPIVSQPYSNNCNGTDTDSTIVYGGDGASISNLQFHMHGTIFYGRFLPVALSDGRVTTIVNRLVNISSDQIPVATIGIDLPNCRSCLVDPDFSTLIGGSNTNGECTNTDDNIDSNTWKIIVGCVVGGAAVVAIVIGTLFYMRRKANFKIMNHNVKMRLQRSFTSKSSRQ
ncbi:hypothetical protein DFA_04307 [Cavenderia fasciculata]|uniref:EGF-like domain-containing protein n=1 Tax=Cavenderia fasciculata TaxID=261658 RepID=F4PP76_CACFS|nr:uncharacterized protein DFA_04307 [Cavenderia fasciculata]EGG22189.1 hypothetical protein DFA_04307 [Cavenderia fasciculata]|eukprot:XP_004360040.1 hypothetical protein DFA_04307 [Cavenderia fasciculata]